MICEVKSSVTMPHNNKRQNNFNKFNNRNRGKSFHRGKKYQPNSFQRSGPKKERPNAEQLTEQDVGITEYISQHPGFSGIIKARFSDFHVNEIDWEGNVAKLTDTNVPEDLNEGLFCVIFLYCLLSYVL